MMTRDDQAESPHPPEGGSAEPQRPQDFRDARTFFVGILGLSTAFLVALGVATLTHVLPLGWILAFVEARPPRPDLQQIADRFVSMAIEEQEEEEPPPPPPPPPPEPEPPREPEPAPRVEAEPEPEPEPEPPAEDQRLALEGIGNDPGGIRLDSGTRSVHDSPPPPRRSAPPAARPAAAPAPEPPPRQRRQPVRLEEAHTAPNPLRQEPPLGYPRQYREAAIAGLVVVQCVITERGEVRGCRHRSGPEELATYVMSVVRQWEFSPGLDHQGQPIAIAYTFRVPFRLT